MNHRQRRRTWLSEILIVTTLMLLPLLFWWRLWAPDPADRAAISEGDFTSQYYPLQLFSARELAAGRVPAWDPYINAGQPGLADIQTGFFYPLNLLPNLALAALGLPFSVGLLTAQVVVHFSLASLFTYLFARHLARRAGAKLAAARFAGAVAAVSFTYAGYLTSFPVQQLTILETAIWLPLILFFLDRAFHAANFWRTSPWPQLILSGMAFACALLAGHPQTAMYVAYATLAYGLFLAWTTHFATYALLPLIIGVALAAVQLLPTLQFISHSTRAGLDYEAVAWGFPLAEISHLLYPGYFGGSPQYVGILTPILAMAALFIKRARREVVFWIILGIVALLLAFGGHTFFYSLAYLLAPGLNAVRNQERVIYLFSFAVSILAGYGVLALVQPLPPSVRRGFRRFVSAIVGAFFFFLALTALWYYGYLQGQQQGVEVNLFAGVLRHHTLLLVILGGSTALFVLRLRGKVRRAWLMALALGLIGLNLFTINWQYNLADAAGKPFPGTGLVSFLKEQPGLFRISGAGHLPGGSSAGIVYELEDITGNTPLRLESFARFEDQVKSWRRWQLLNVEYVLSRRDIGGPGLERVYEEGEVKVFRIGDPLPRAWVVGDAVVADDRQVFDMLNAEPFDPRTTAVLPPGSPDLALGGSGGTARIVESTPGRLALDVTARGDNLLLVSQPFYPGWRATVDGETAPILRANYLLQGVPLKTGTHRVELNYYPSPWPAFISLLALVGCLAGLVFRGSGRRA